MAHPVNKGWGEGELASAGFTLMAEKGSTFLLLDEVAARILDGSADKALSLPQWVVPGAAAYEFDIDEAAPLVSFVSMLGPSPRIWLGSMCTARASSSSVSRLMLPNVSM